MRSDRQRTVYNPRVEVLAGATAFLSSAYVLFLIPSMLADVGLPIAETTTAVALVATLASIATGVVAGRPLLVAPGIGTTAYLVYGVVSPGALALPQAIAAALCAGICFLALSAIGLHDFLYRAIPPGVRRALVVGIGLFLVVVGARSAGLLEYEPGSLPKLGSFTDPRVLLAAAGLALIGGLLRLRVPSALLIGVGATTALAWQLHLTPTPSQVLSAPTWPGSIAFSWGLDPFPPEAFALAMLSFLLLLIVDVTGALAALQGVVGPDGDSLASRETYGAVAGGTVVGALFGVSPSVVLLESAVGLRAGGRTGLTAVAGGLLFPLALFVTPVLAAIPAAATGPLVIAVGLMMARGGTSIARGPWSQAIPALATIAALVLTLNIANGLAAGMLCHVPCALLSKSSGRLHSSSALLASALAAYLLLDVLAR